MSVFKEASFKRQRVRSKQLKTESHEKAKEGRKGGKGFRFASLQKLFWYSIPVAWIFHMPVSDPLFQATELSDARFLWCAYVAGQPFCWITQLFTKLGSATQKDVHAPLGRRYQLCSRSELAKQTITSGTYQLVSVSAFARKKNIMSDIRNSDYSPHIHEAMEMQI